MTDQEKKLFEEVAESLELKQQIINNQEKIIDLQEQVINEYRKEKLIQIADDQKMVDLDKEFWKLVNALISDKFLVDHRGLKNISEKFKLVPR